MRYIDADNPTGPLLVFLPREADHEYDIDHFEDTFFIRTNYQATNFRLMETPLRNTSKDHWKDVIPHRKEVFLETFDIFKDYLVVEERRNGLIELRIRPWSGKDEHYLEFDEPAYLAYISTNKEFDTDKLRFVYESMTTPECTYDYDMSTRKRVLLKQEIVLGGFDANNYETARPASGRS